MTAMQRLGALASARAGETIFRETPPNSALPFATQPDRMSEPIIASWPKNGRATLQVRLDTFKGQPIVDCRSWYAGSDGSLKPGRGGLTVSVRHLLQLAEALAKAMSMVTTGDIVTTGIDFTTTGIDIIAGNDSQNE